MSVPVGARNERGQSAGETAWFERGGAAPPSLVEKKVTEKKCLKILKKKIKIEKKTNHNLCKKKKEEEASEPPLSHPQVRLIVLFLHSMLISERQSGSAQFVGSESSC